MIQHEQSKHSMVLKSQKKRHYNHSLLILRLNL